MDLFWFIFYLNRLVLCHYGFLLSQLWFWLWLLLLLMRRCLLLSLDWFLLEFLPLLLYHKWLLFDFLWS